QATTWLGQGTGAANDALSALCATVGMRPFPELRDSLLLRYGAEAEDFCPFPETTIKEIVEETIGETNRARVNSNDSTPLWIWWCTEALLDGDHPDFDLASELWESSPSIAIVDSISIRHPDIYRQFADLPEPEKAALSA